MMTQLAFELAADLEQTQLESDWSNLEVKNFMSTGICCNVLLVYFLLTRLNQT